MRGSGGGSIVYHLQSGGHLLLPVIIFKRLHPQSVYIMVGLFGHSQFNGLIRVLQMSVCISVLLCVFIHVCFTLALKQIITYPYSGGELDEKIKYEAKANSKLA